MALTRKMLKALGIEDEKIEQIIDAHTETVEGLKERLTTVQADAEKLSGVQKELDALKAGGDFKAKFEKEHADFEAYKKDITAKEQRAAKEKAVRAYFESKNIKGGNLDIAMRGASSEIDAAELDGEKIKDTSSLDTLIAGTYKGLVVDTVETGTNTSNPPANGGTRTQADYDAMSDAEYYKATYDAAKKGK